ncbi:hypothetical protein [Rhodococcus koreensis]|nr:hypothetical protein [Rhodococcus koreensis]
MKLLLEQAVHIPLRTADIGLAGHISNVAGVRIIDLCRRPIWG